MNLTGHFQNAYVTRDLDQALDIARDTYGVTSEFIRIDPDADFITPDGPRHVQVRVAITWVGGLQLEIIEPVAGYVDHFVSCLPEDYADPGLRLNHICVRRDDLDAMQAEIEASGLPRIYEAGFPGGYFVYVDTRETLGHILEYAWATPDGWRTIHGWPDGRPV